MECMYCGAGLNDSAYCPECGRDVSVQKQAVVLSALYYNRGLEKAEVRDLGGAVDLLKRSLKFDKLNIPARNLLGLVYFESGEVVAALSEWVISKNITTENNPATEYIERLRRDANRLDVINRTVKKFNTALENCREGHEDVAVIQLRSILKQNPKLIKGYHLLALLYIHKGEYEKARGLLKKAISIDKTNTTTLRFLHEVDEQTGKVTRLESKRGHRFADPEEEEQPKEKAPSKEYGDGRVRSARTRFAGLLTGIVFGALVMWFLVIPVRTNALKRQVNEQVSEYAAELAVDRSRIQTLQDTIRSSEETVSTAEDRIDAANARAVAYENLLKAINANAEESFDTAHNAMKAVDKEQLSIEAKAVYERLEANISASLIATFRKQGIDAYNQGDFNTAKTKLMSAYEVDPDDYTVILYLGHTWRALGNTKEADAMYQKIISLLPGTQMAMAASQYLSTYVPPEE